MSFPSLPRRSLRPALLPAFLLFVALGAAAIPAQGGRVVPNGFLNVEGNRFLNYPFGRTDGALQILIDGDQISASNSAVLTGFSLRTDPGRSSSGYTMGYRVTVYSTPVAAAGMGKDLAVNAGNTTGTVVFQGPLTLPSASAGREPGPGAFDISIPFSAPYLFDATADNLLLLIEADDPNPPSLSTYYLDAANLRDDRVEGLSATVTSSGCSGVAGTVQTTVDPSQAVSGGQIGVAVTATSPASMGAVFVLAGLGRADTDLSNLLGTAGCTARVDPAAPIFFALSARAGTGYPSVTFPIPNVPAAEGLEVMVQGLGVPDPVIGLSGSVLGNTEAVRIGSSSPAVQRSMSAFSNDGGLTWFLGTVGTFVPVVRVEGAL